jgi:hypothetical protein
MKTDEERLKKIKFGERSAFRDGGSLEGTKWGFNTLVSTPASDNEFQARNKEMVSQIFMNTDNDLIHKYTDVVAVKMINDRKSFKVNAFNEDILGEFLDEAEFNAVISQA